MKKFKDVTACFADRFILSCSNSAATLKVDHSSLPRCMVRPGLALYGLPPSDQFIEFGLKPLMRLRVKPNMIKVVKKGGSVGYGNTYCAEEDMEIAVLPIGYADGYDRSLSNRGMVRFGTEYCPLVGRISMDEITIRIDHLKEKVTLETILDVITPDLDPVTSLTGLAKMTDTISYEVATGMARRLPRIYIK